VQAVTKIVFILLLMPTSVSFSADKNQIGSFLLTTCASSNKNCVTISSKEAFGIFGSTQDFDLRNPTVKVFVGHSKSPKITLSGESGVLNLSAMDLILKTKSNSYSGKLIRLTDGQVTDI
jgi:hypothetical protein